MSVTISPSTSSGSGPQQTLTANQQIVQDAYQNAFGRDASFGTLGGASYWTDQIANNNLDAAGLASQLAASAEGQSVTTDATTGTKSSWLGGVNPNVGTGHSSNVGTWADHFKDGGTFGPGADLTGTIWEGMGGGAAGNQGTDDSATALNAIAADIGTPINNLSGAYYNMGSTGPGPVVTTGPGVTPPVTPPPVTPPDTSQYLTQQGLTDWWDALDKSSFSGNQSSTGGMDDFMKFMMLMSVMGGGGQGGGYGGSQYGYGGLNPGGVQAASNPLANLQGMGDWFKNNFGSGGGTAATTATVNAT